MRKTTISIIITLSVLSVNSLFSQKDYISKTYYNLKDSIEISLYTDVATERFEIFSDKEQIPNKDVKWIYWTEGVTIECDFPPVYFFSEGTIESIIAKTKNTKFKNEKYIFDSRTPM